MNAENYHAKAKNFMDLHQREDGLVGVMLDRDADHSQWEHWRQYFQEKLIPHKRMRHVVTYMVPAAWPSDFDGEWNWGVPAKRAPSAPWEEA